MKLFCIALIIGLVKGQGTKEGSAKILNQDFDNDGTGPFSYHFETDNGIVREETASSRVTESRDVILRVTGRFKYPGPDGVTYEVRYVANETGFYPEGAHIKVPAVVPWPSSSSLDESSSSSLSDTSTKITENSSSSSFATDNSASDANTGFNVNAAGQSASSIGISENSNSSSQVTEERNDANLNVASTYLPPTEPPTLPPLTLPPTLAPYPNNFYLPPKTMLRDINNMIEPPIVDQRNSREASELITSQLKLLLQSKNVEIEPLPSTSERLYFVIKPRGFQ